MCHQIVPHYGWLDSEINSYDESSYESIDTDDWSVENDFVVVGPQLIDQLSKGKLRDAPNLFKALGSGCLLLRSSYAYKNGHRLL